MGSRVLGPCMQLHWLPERLGPPISRPEASAPGRRPADALAHRCAATRATAMCAARPQNPSAPICGLPATRLLRPRQQGHENFWTDGRRRFPDADAIAEAQPESPAVRRGRGHAELWVGAETDRVQPPRTDRNAARTSVRPCASRTFAGSRSLPDSRPDGHRRVTTEMAGVLLGENLDDDLVRLERHRGVGCPGRGK